MPLTRKEIAQNFYKRRKENGLCPVCGKKMDREGHYCTECLEKNRKYRRENRDFYRKNHICTQCGKKNVYGDDKICFECRVKYDSRRKPRTDVQKENFRKQQNDLYQQRVKEGICTRCGKTKAVSGKKKCASCLFKDREVHRKQSAKKINIKEYRKKNRLCYYCGEPIDLDSGQLCSKCIEICRQNRAKNHSTNEYWRQDNRSIFRRKE